MRASQPEAEELTFSLTPGETIAGGPPVDSLDGIALPRQAEAGRYVLLDVRMRQRFAVPCRCFEILLVVAT